MHKLMQFEPTRLNIIGILLLLPAQSRSTLILKNVRRLNLCDSRSSMLNSSLDTSTVYITLFLFLQAEGAATYVNIIFIL